MGFWNLMFSYDGRIGRANWWLGSIGIIVIFTGISVALALTFVGIFLLPLLWLPAYWTIFAVNAKRWHDRDKSGWWSLVTFVPVIGTIWILVECGFLPGTDGPNRFGIEPS